VQNPGAAAPQYPTPFPARFLGLKSDYLKFKTSDSPIHIIVIIGVIDSVYS
jgi:hypothetical protein